MTPPTAAAMPAQTVAAEMIRFCDATTEHGSIDAAVVREWAARLQALAGEAALMEREAAQGEEIDEMVNRFLCWKFPNDFAPDGGISFTPSPIQSPGNLHWPVGTNLLNAVQAKAMLTHILSALAPPVSAAPAGEGWPTSEPRYSVLFNAIAAATKPEGGGAIGVSVAAFLASLKAAAPSPQQSGEAEPAGKVYSVHRVDGGAVVTLDLAPGVTLQVDQPLYAHPAPTQPAAEEEIDDAAVERALAAYHHGQGACIDAHERHYMRAALTAAGKGA